MLNQRTDFRDDGGTPAWRRRQILIEVPKPGPIAAWKRMPFVRKLRWIATVGFVVPWAIFIGGVLGGSLTARLLGQ